MTNAKKSISPPFHFRDPKGELYKPTKRTKPSREVNILYSLEKRWETEQRGQNLQTWMCGPIWNKRTKVHFYATLKVQNVNICADKLKVIQKRLNSIHVAWLHVRMEKARLGLSKKKRDEVYKISTRRLWSVLILISICCLNIESHISHMKVKRYIYERPRWSKLHLQISNKIL